MAKQYVYFLNIFIQFGSNNGAYKHAKILRQQQQKLHTDEQQTTTHTNQNNVLITTPVDKHI